MPNMPGLGGYSEFRRQLNYDPANNTAPDTRYLDNWLMSLTMDYDNDSVKLAMQAPDYDYVKQLQQIQNLTSTYHGQKNRRRIEHLVKLTMPRHKMALNTYVKMLDSVSGSAELVALMARIQDMANQIDSDIEEVDALTGGLAQGAARAALVQDIAARKQRDLIALTSAITLGYSINQKFSLRKLARARKSGDDAKVNRAKELIKTRASIPAKPKAMMADASMFARSLAAVDFYSRKFGQYRNAIKENSAKTKQPITLVTRDTIIINIRTGQVTRK